MKDKRQTSASVVSAVAFILISVLGVMFISKKGYSAWLYVLLFLVVAPMFASVAYMAIAPSSDSEENKPSSTTDIPVATVSTSSAV